MKEHEDIFCYTDSRYTTNNCAFHRQCSLPKNCYILFPWNGHQIAKCLLWSFPIPFNRQLLTDNVFLIFGENVKCLESFMKTLPLDYQFLTLDIGSRIRIPA